jgi:thimet oligopeptidase
MSTGAATAEGARAPGGMELERELEAALGAVRAAAARFKALPAATPAPAVVLAYDRVAAPLNGLADRAHLFAKAHPDARVRALCDRLEQDVARLSTELSLDREMWMRLRTVDPAALADPADRRLLEHALRDFRRSGVDRDDEARARIRGLQDELVRVGQEFDRNLVERGRTHVVRGGHAELRGLPADFLAAHPEREDGSVLLSTDPQDRIPVLTYAASGALRRAYFHSVQNRAVPENLAVLPRLVALRQELAEQLGSRSWADYVTEDKMARDAASVRAFLVDVGAEARAKADEEVAEMLEEKRLDEPDARAVGEWDRLFLVERLRRRKHGFDSQSVRPYFPYRAVRDGVLATASTLYGVEFRRVASELWHPAVELYELWERGELRARVLLDMHPRDGKYKHAAMFDQARGLAGERIPEAALLCNFPEPRGGDPALLEHDQVTTFFHEFGHLLHHLFAGGQTRLAFSGIACEWDFVEVPSQLFEEWAWDARVLQGFARHFESGEPIPTALVERMRAADEYGKALHVAVQLFYARFSLELYARPADAPPLDADGIARLLDDLRVELLPLEGVPDGKFQASFGHLNGYSAMYYTYMWSLVIAKDLRSAFARGLMDRATAKRYREVVLGPGGSRDAAELVREFLGRPYDFDAFRRWLER